MHIDSIRMACVFCTDLEKSLWFYRDVLGVQSLKAMAEDSYYAEFESGQGFYLAIASQVSTPASAAFILNRGLSFVLSVDSCSEYFERLQLHECRTVQQQPQKMNDSLYWFQAFDPDGNCVEFLGPA